MTVFENMSFGLKLAKTPKDVIERKVREAARILQLDAFLDRYPKALSGGQRQRVAIGRAIVREPGCSCSTNRSPISMPRCAARPAIEIARLHQRFANASVVYVTHDQVEAMTLADKIVLLHAGADADCFGSIAQTGAPLTLYHHPESRFVAGFIGSPRMNFLDAVVESIEPGRVTVKLLQSDERLSAHVDGARLTIGQPVSLGVRPEHLRIGRRRPVGSMRRRADGTARRAQLYPCGPCRRRAGGEGAR